MRVFSVRFAEEMEIFLLFTSLDGKFSRRKFTNRLSASFYQNLNCVCVCVGGSMSILFKNELKEGSDPQNGEKLGSHISD